MPKNQSDTTSAGLFCPAHVVVSLVAAKNLGSGPREERSQVQKQKENARASGAGIDTTGDAY
jgi:hypothetical protein